MNTWSGILSGLVGGLLALAGVLVTQSLAARRDREARLWTRRADAYVALLQWRLNPPDEAETPNPEIYADMEERWRAKAYPLLAEIGAFGGPRMREPLRRHPYLFQAVRDFAKMRPQELADIAHSELTQARRQRSAGPG